MSLNSSVNQVPNYNNHQRIIKRAHYACERCRVRKKKCDSDGVNKCSDCKKADANCIIPEIQAQNYTKSLEDKIRVLEMKLRNAGTTEVAAPSMISSKEKTNTGEGEDLREMESVSSDSTSSDSDSGLIKYAAYISMGSEAETCYIGPSSGISLANIVQQVVFNHALGISFPFPDDSDSDRPDRNEQAVTQDIFLSKEQSHELIEIYLKNVHIRFPILEKTAVYQWHEDRKRILLSPKSRDDHLKQFSLYMVYAIGSRYAQILSQPNKFGAPEGFYNAALKEIMKVLAVKDMSCIKCVALVVIYSLRSPIGPGIWNLIGFCIRVGIQLGLHRKKELIQPAQAYEHVMRRRIFWSLYSLDRVISISFGRPCSISDSDIDIEMPAEIDEDITDPNQLFSILTSDVQNQHPITNLSLGFHLLKLRRLDSEIQSGLYSVNRVDPPLVEEASKFLRKLYEWGELVPKIQTSFQRDYISILYHKSLRNLLVPFIVNLPADHNYSLLCFDSAVSICELSKKLHQDGTYAHSFIALQTVFMAGLTVIYGLWTNKLEWNFKISNSIHGCSTVLFVIAERSPATKRYRDVFETLLTRTTRYLEATKNDANSKPNFALVQREEFSPEVRIAPFEDLGFSYEFSSENEKNEAEELPSLDDSSHFANMDADELWKMVYEMSRPTGSNISQYNIKSWIDSQDLDFADFVNH